MPTTTPMQKPNLSSQPTFEHELRSPFHSIIFNLLVIQQILIKLIAKGSAEDSDSKQNSDSNLTALNQGISSIIENIKGFISEVTKILDEAEKKAKEGIVITEVGAKTASAKKTVAQKCYALCNTGLVLLDKLGKTSTKLIEIKSDADEVLQGIDFSIKHLCALIHPLLEKVDQDILDSHLVRGSVPVVAIARSMRFMFKAQADEKKLEINCNVGSGVTEISINDALSFRQALINPVSNALKATEKGSITIDLSLKENDKLAVSVKDTGKGMPPEEVKKINNGELYFKGDSNSPKRSGSATGLGLPTCKKIAEELGGEFSVTSEVGKGTAVTFTVAAEKLLKEKPVVQTQADEKSQNPVVLIADDEPINRKILRHMLRLQKLRCEFVCNGQEAVNFCEKCKKEDSPAVILMDIQMPVMGGLEATSQLQSKGFKMPIVALTANAPSEAAIKQVQNAGMIAYVAKPFDKKNIFEIISNVSSIKLVIDESDSPSKSTVDSTSSSITYTPSASPITVPTSAEVPASPISLSPQSAKNSPSSTSRKSSGSFLLNSPRSLIGSWCGFHPLPPSPRQQPAVDVPASTRVISPMPCG